MGCNLWRLQLALEGRVEVFKATWPWGSSDDADTGAEGQRSLTVRGDDDAPRGPDATGLYLFLRAQAAQATEPAKMTEVTDGG